MLELSNINESTTNKKPLLENYNDKNRESNKYDKQQIYGQTHKTPHKYGNLTRYGANWYVGNNCKRKSIKLFVIYFAYYSVYTPTIICNTANITCYLM